MVHFSVQPQENNKDNKNNEMEVEEEDDCMNQEGKLFCLISLCVIFPLSPIFQPQNFDRNSSFFVLKTLFRNLLL